MDNQQIRPQYRTRGVEASSEPSVLVKFLLLKTFASVEQELFTTQRMSTLTLHEICLCPITHLFTFGEKFIAPKQLLHSKY